MGFWQHTSVGGQELSLFHHGEKWQQQQLGPSAYLCACSHASDLNWINLSFGLKMLPTSALRGFLQYVGLQGNVDTS